VLLTAATVVALTLLVAGVVVSWKWWEAEAAKGKVEEALAEAKEAEKKARLREAEALVGQAHGTRLSRRPGQRFDTLAALNKAAAIGRELKQPPEWFDRLRNEAITALALPDLQIRQEFGHIPPGKAAVTLSDDFELYAYTSEQGDCTVRRVADDALVAPLPKLGTFAGAVFGPGRTLAVHGGPESRLQVWDVSGTEPVCRVNEKAVYGWSFHPNGRYVLVTYQNGAISIYETVTGTLAHQLAAKDPHRELRFHPTEPFIAGFSYISRVVVVRDLQTGAIVASAESPWPLGNGHGDWSPDGRTLLVPRADDASQILEYAFDLTPPGLRPLRTFNAPYQGCPQITFNPAGDRFVTRGWSRTVHLFDAISGELLFKAPATSVWERAELHFDRTGQRLAAARVGDRNDRIGVWSIAACREYRSLVASGSASDHWHESFAIHPGGRLAALGRKDGVALFDLETGRELAYLSLPGGQTYPAFDGAGNLLTNGMNGFFRWPVRSDPARPGRLSVGPPQRLPFNKGHHPVAASQDGRVIAQAMFNGYGMDASAGGWILHPDSPTPRRVDAGIGMFWTSVSPDGRWVAFGVHNGPLRVYDAATGQRVWQAPGVHPGGFCFSRDGRWLLTTEDGGQIYEVGTWKPGPQLGPGTPYDATTERAVLVQSDGIHRLVELATGRELARLEDPEQTIGRAAFSPDGTQLVIEAKNGLRVWDLRLIREGLEEMGLDWAAPPYPKAEGAGKRPRLEVTVDRGDLDAYLVAEQVGNELRRKGDVAGALAALQKAQALAPADPGMNNELAYLLALCPDPKLRDPQRAVELARKAVNAAPNTWSYWSTLGIAYHFAGDDAAAVKALTRSLELRKSAEAVVYFPLAAAHQKLGHKEEARKWYDRGVAWMAANKHPYVAELTILRADAEALLGIEKQATPAPDKTSPDQKE
jgi:WD40 repeat protein